MQALFLCSYSVLPIWNKTDIIYLEKCQSHLRLPFLSFLSTILGNQIWPIGTNYIRDRAERKRACPG